MSVEVMSFAECTATSIRSASSASSISLTKTPRSPICPNGLERSRSPAVVIGTKATSWPARRMTRRGELGLRQREPGAARADADEHLRLPSSSANRRRIASAYASPSPSAAACFIRTVGSCRSLFRICAVTASSVRRSSSGSAAELRELGGADLLGVGAQRRDRRHDVERGAPLAEALGLLDDEPLGHLGLGAPAGERLGDDRLEVVDVVEEAAVELVHRGIDVARDGDVDEEERACGGARHVARPITSPGARSR